MIAQTVKIKRVWITVGAVAATAAVTALAVMLIVGGRLSRALKRLDISNEATVIRVMKYGGKNRDIVLRVASEYYEAGEYAPAAKLMLYSQQYLGENDKAGELLRNCYARLGADDTQLLSLDFSGFVPSDFEVTTSYEGNGYGSAADGVYTSFCGGYARARISAVIPLALSAAKTGVYALDGADSFLKLISEDGLTVNVISQTPLREFLVSDDTLYTIDENGTPCAGNDVILLADGEQAMRLRKEDDSVLCTIYDENFNMLRDMTL